MNRLFIILSVLIFSSAFTGCSMQGEFADIEPTTTITPTLDIITTDETIDATDSTTNEITVKGIYVGLIDGNSFEAIIDSVPIAFRHEDCASFIDKANISDGDSVEITYIHNENGQNIALTITPIAEISISELFPIKMNVYKKYQGIGNEYAEYETTVEFITTDRIQIKTNNSGTSVANVYEVTNEYVKKIYSESEVYDIVDYTRQINRDEIILKSPIQVGTTWTTDSNTQRSITAIDERISTPYCDFCAIEVRTMGEYSTMLDYYVVGVGHVMSVFEDNETKDQIRSELMILQ